MEGWLAIHTAVSAEVLALSRSSIPTTEELIGLQMYGDVKIAMIRRVMGPYISLELHDYML